jgi:PAS domain S-box-containing protein
MAGQSGKQTIPLDLGHIPAAALILSREGTIQQANMAAARLLSVEHGRLPGQPFTPFITPEAQTRFTAFLHDAFAGQKHAAVEFPLLGEDRRWVQAEAQVVAQNNTAVCCLVLVEISHYKQMETQAQQQADLLANVSDAVVTTDPNFVIRSWNKGAEAIYGWTATEVIGRIFPEVVPTTYPDDNRDEVLQAFQQDGYWRGEVIQQTKEGRSRHMLSTSAWLRDSHGHLVGAMAINHDITHRKQAEERMRQNEQIFRLFVEHSPAALAMFDRDMNYIVASRRYLIDYDLSEQDLVGRSHYDVFPDVPDRWQEIHALCLAGEVLKADEDPFPRSDGRLDWVRWEIRPWYEDDGQIGGIILFSEVITKQKEAQIKLRQATSRYQMLVEQNPAVIFLDKADEAGTNTYISPQIERLLGYSSEAYAENPNLWHEQIFPDDYELATASIKEVLQSGKAAAEYRMVRRDGRIVWIRDSSVLVRDEQGKPEFIQGFLEDITEHKQAEEALKESEAFLQATLDALSAHIAILDETGNILAVNEAWREFGRENNFTLANDGVGSSYLQPVDQAQGEWGDEAAAVARAIRAIMAGEIEEAHIEYPCHSPTEKRWFMTHITGFKKSEQAHVVVSHENVTARKLAEESMRETKNLLEKVFASLHEAVFVIDPQERTIITCNAAVEPIFGYTPEELIGQDTAVLYHSPEDFERFGVIGEPYLTQKGVFKTEYVMRRKDGQSIITENTVSSLGNHNDWQNGVVSLVRDITERNEIETKLRQNEERFRTLIENAPGAITLIDSNGHLKFASSSTERVMGYRPEEALGRSPAELTHPDDLPALLAILQDLLQKPGAVRTTQYRFRHKDGSWRWVESSISNLLHIPAIEAIAFNFLDITERKELESQLHDRVQLAEFQAAIGAALIEPGGLKQQLQKCAQAIVDSFAAAFARIWTLNEAEQMLELQASAGLYTHLNGDYSRIPVGELKIGRIAQEQRPHLSNNIADDPTIGDPDWARQQGLVAFAGYPLLIEDRIVGTLAMFARHPLTEQHVQVLGTIANNVALAIESKRTEEALKQSQLLLQIAGETAKIGGWIFDLETGRITWSDEVRAIHEAPPGNPTIDETIAYYTPEYRSIIKAALEACTRDGLPYDEELQIITTKGERRWVRTIGQAVRDSAGKIIQVQGAFQDITEAKEIEDSLLQSQQRFRQLADAMPMVVWTAEPDGTLDYTNQFFADYTGTPDMDLPAQEWLAVAHPDDLEYGLAMLSKAVATGTMFSVESRMLRHDGLYRWHLIQATPIRNHKDEIIKWYGTATDIHDSRTMEEEMRQLANRLTITLESITDAFCTLDHDWRFTYINQEAERLLQRKRDELLGQVIWDEFSEAVDTNIYQKFQQAIQGNRAVSFEEFYTPLDTWFEIHAYPSEEGLAVYFRDITARKEAEQQLNTQLEELRRWHKATLGRENRILDLKQEVNTLLRQAGQPARYASAEANLSLK